MKPPFDTSVRAVHEIILLRASCCETGCTARSARPLYASIRSQLFGNLQGIVHLDTEIAHCRLKFGMPKQQLHCCTARRFFVRRYINVALVRRIEYVP